MGTVDVNVNQQFQKAFWKNTNASSDLLVARIYLRNGLFRPASGVGRIFVVLTNAGDAGKQVRLQEVVGGVVVPESINTPSGTGTANAAAGAQGAVQWAERAQLVDVNSGAQVAALEDVQIWWGTNINTATLLGIIPGPSANGLQWSWATGEVHLLGISSLDDTATITSRRTAPVGTFTRAYDYSSGVVVTLNSSGGADTLTHGHAQGFWAQQVLQPGMPPADNV